jgi:lambda repressor-like predicted transcriptional regulator
MVNSTLIDQIPPNPFVRRAWIIFQLHVAAGISLATIADDEGCSRQAVSLALTHPNARLEEAIAQRLGVTAAQLFPERFDEHGTRLHVIRETNRTPRPRVRERGKAGAR